MDATAEGEDTMAHAAHAHHAMEPGLDDALFWGALSVVAGAGA